MLGAGKAADRSGGAHDRKLMLRIKAIEVHLPAPHSKRERDGLSAKDAYNAKALSGAYVALATSKNKVASLGPNVEAAGLSLLEVRFVVASRQAAMTRSAWDPASLLSGEKVGKVGIARVTQFGPWHEPLCGGFERQSPAPISARGLE